MKYLKGRFNVSVYSPEYAANYDKIDWSGDTKRANAEPDFPVSEIRESEPGHQSSEA